MAHDYDQDKRYRPIFEDKIFYPGKGSPHIAHLYGTREGWPQHFDRMSEAPKGGELVGKEAVSKEGTGQ